MSPASSRSRCGRCKRPLTFRRSDALYCSTTCRVQAHRRRRDPLLAFVDEHQAGLDALLAELGVDARIDRRAPTRGEQPAPGSWQESARWLEENAPERWARDVVANAADGTRPYHRGRARNEPVAGAPRRS
jgi:hypothetical protein